MKKMSLLLFFSTTILFSQNSTETCQILNKINVLIQTEHIRPKPVNDSLSMYVFDNLINELDPSRNIFFKTEYDEMAAKYRLNLDDLILANDCSFLADIKAKYTEGLT